jgi:hypothetical protein
MRKEFLIIVSAVLVSAATPVMAHAKAVAHSARLHHTTIRNRERNAAYAHSNVTSFSSSSTLNIGVNHPPRR